MFFNPGRRIVIEQADSLVGLSRVGTKPDRLYFVIIEVVKALRSPGLYAQPRENTKAPLKYPLRR